MICDLSTRFLERGNSAHGPKCCRSAPKNRVVRISKLGGPDGLEVVEEPKREPGAGEVRLRVHAVGLNRAEVMYRTGMYTETPQVPARIGSEASGVIEALGPGVTQFQVGDRVSTFPGFSMNQYGVLADTAVVPANHVIKLPANLTFNEGAAIWTQYLTAHECLIRIAQIKEGDTVAITAASSSVGIAAIQTVNDAGGISVAITRKSSKRSALLAAGARYVITTESEDLNARVKEITEGRGAGVIFDPVSGPSLEKLGDIAAPEGMIIEYGWLQPGVPVFPMVPALVKGLSVHAFHLSFQLVPHQDRLAAALAYITKRVETGVFRPILADAVFSLDQVASAYSYMESNEHVGKIVITTDHVS